MAKAPSNLPRQTTSFVARESQIEEVRTRLQNPDCRLLTLVGPGGIGKTRLAIAVAQTWDAPVVYAPLQAVASADLIPSAIADAAGYTLAGPELLPEQLLNHLRDKRMLLLLDNFEHLLDGTDLLLDILLEAPEVNLLLTSREALNMREEWLYTVQGLSCPPAESQADPASYGAVQLFVERAKQVRQNFRLEDDVASVVAICRAVDGMPLAIELAASWLSALNRAAIADRLTSSLDVLTTQLRNVPDRHQSIRAVFDASWQMLSPGEREVFAKLSVFRGGFTYEAAESVAGADDVVLAALVSKSLITRDDGGRYQIHELLRQYAAQKLAESLEEEEAARRHGEYYLRLLLRNQVSTSFAFASVAKSELDNMRLAWHWALDHGEYSLVRDTTNRMGILFQLHSRYQEGADLFLHSVHLLQSRPMTEERAGVLSELATHYGWLCLRLGRLEEAERVLAPARDLFDEFHVSTDLPLGRQPFVVSMHVALSRGDYARATAFGKRLRTVADESSRRAYDFNRYFPPANAAIALGDYASARRFSDEGMTRVMSTDNVRDTAFYCSILGQVARIEGDLDAAALHCESAYRVYEELDEPGGMADIFAHLADVAAAREEWSEARQLYVRSFSIYDQIGDRGGIIRARLGLGVVARETAEPAVARSHFLYALKVVAETQLTPLLLRIAAEAGDLLLRENSTYSLGLQALSFVQAHSACDAETRTRVANTLARNGLTPGNQLRDPSNLVDSPVILVDALKTELATPSSRFQTLEPLVEPLTPREEEVLRLLALGRSNTEIAAELIIAEGTVKAHASNIYRKLGVANRTRAVAHARELGLLA